MNYLQKIKIKTGVEKKSPMTLKATHITTSNFGEFGIIKAIDLPPDCRGRLKTFTYSNMLPMPQPTFGEVVYKNIWYWVPYRTIFKGFNDFDTDTIHVTPNGTSVALDELPYIKNSSIVRWFITKADPGTSADYDFAATDTLNVTNFYKHNKETKRVWKILLSIGIKPIMNEKNNVHINMMRLLAVTKVYTEYYYNIAYAGDADYNTLKSMYERDNGTLEYTYIDFSNLVSQLINCYYETDYFTGCWDQPNHPNITNQESTYHLNDPNNINQDGGKWYSEVTNNDSQNMKDPYIMGTDRTDPNNPIRKQGPITEVMVNMLKGLTMFLKRNQLAGGTALQRLMARYGIRPGDEVMKKAVHLGTDQWSMNVSPIFSNSDTAAAGGEQLGAYAGYGYAREKDDFWVNIETKEFGILVGINTIQPVIMYLEGMDGMNLNNTRTELWKPEFDNIGVDVVRVAELKVSNIGSIEYTGGLNNQDGTTAPFGFIPRYARWKTIRDTLSGDYTIKSWKNIYEPYTLQRVIPDDLLSNLVHSKGFTKQEDMDQYQRIFYSQEKTLYDSFNIIHQLQLEMYTGMKPLYDYYDWEHEGGNEIEMQNQGPTFN